MKRPSILITLCLISHFLSAQSVWYVATTGDDNDPGSFGQPWQTLHHAVTQVGQGDVIILRGGTYAGDVTVATDNIRIESFAGEWAVISSPTTDPNEQQALWFNASGGEVRNLELEGGYFYALKFEEGDGLVSGCKLHGSGRDCIKIVPDADDITIEDCEIYESGQRDPSNADGIDNVNADRMVVRRCYIHDIATNGGYAKGGPIDCVFENNLVVNCGGGGFYLGFFTDLQFFDPVSNPNYHGNIDGTIRNNYIINTEGPGIGLFAALRPRVYHNTLLQVAESSRGGIHFEPVNNDNQLRYVVDPVVVNNIVTLSPTSSRTLIEDRNGGMTGNITLDYNRYYDEDGTDEFRYGGGVVNFATWQGSVPGGDPNSTLGDALLDPNSHLTAASPCRDAAASGYTAIDYDGATRDQTPDIGADEYDPNCANLIPPMAPQIGTGSDCDSGLVAIDVPADPRLSIYPNPAWNYIRIEGRGFAVTEPVHVQVSDLQGRVVYRGKWHVQPAIELSVHDMSPGPYFVWMWQSDWQVSGRFVKE